MKYLIFILFVFTIQAQNVWYIDGSRSGAGTYDGQSWATAYRYLDNTDYWENNRPDGLNWANVTAGDTIYLSGGVDSLVYTPSMYGQNSFPGITIGYSPTASRSYSFAGGDPVILTKAWHEGHNGRVIFKTDQITQSHVFFIMGVSNIIIRNIEFINPLDPVTAIGSGVIRVGDAMADNDSLVVFDSCSLINMGAGGHFGSSSTKTTLRNSLVYTPPNVLVNGQDPFGFSSGKGGHTIDNNIIIVNNAYEIESGNSTGTGVSVTDTSLTDVALDMITDYHVNNSVWVKGYYLQLTGNNENTFFGDEWVFDEYSPEDSSEVVTTDTSLIDIRGETWNYNLLLGAIIICADDTLIITESINTVHYGSAGWSSGSNPGNGRRYKIVGGGQPVGDSLQWFMGGPHRDIIQISNLGNPGDVDSNGVSILPRLPFTISNNLIIDPLLEGSGWNVLIYNYGWTETPSIEFLIYNNVMVSNKRVGVGAMSLGRINDTRKNTIKLFNNTFITKAPFLSQWSADSAFSINNIFISDTNNNFFYSFDPTHDYRSIDYNVYANKDGVPNDVNFSLWNGVWRTWTQWQALPADVNSITDTALNVVFVDKYDTNKVSYYTETGRSSGVNLWDEYPFLRTDALGNPRPEEGAWDIGALQYIAEGVDTVPTYSFTAVTNAELDSAYVAYSVFAGTDSTFTVYTTTVAQFKIGALDTYSAITKYAELGDTVFIQNTSSTEYSTLTTQTLVAGGVTRSFNVTTKAEPPPVPITGGWLHQSNGRKLFFNNGKAIITQDN